MAHTRGIVVLAAGDVPIVPVLHRYRLGTLRVVLDDAADAPRLGAALQRALRRAGPAGTRVGLLAAGSIAAAALRLAADEPARVAAVVSCNGRPDLAEDALAQVQAPTLLIVGAAQAGLLALNRAALQRLRCDKRLEVVPGGAGCFAEPGALDALAQLSGAWFARHLAPGPWP